MYLDRIQELEKSLTNCAGDRQECCYHRGENCWHYSRDRCESKEKKPQNQKLKQKTKSLRNFLHGKFQTYIKVDSIMINSLHLSAKFLNYKFVVGWLHPCLTHSFFLWPIWIIQKQAQRCFLCQESNSKQSDKMNSIIHLEFPSSGPQLLQDDGSHPGDWALLPQIAESLKFVVKGLLKIAYDLQKAKCCH